MNIIELNDSYRPVRDDDLALSGWSDIAEVAARVICDFESMGVSVPAAARLRRYQQCFVRTADASADEGREELRHALEEIQQFILIAKYAVDSWVPKIQNAMGGNYFAKGDRDGNSARSDQFELYLASALTAAGFVIEFAEPDLLVRVGSDALAIAAKRPRSASQIFRNIRRGSRQLSEHGAPGIVAVDLSLTADLGKPIYMRSVRHMQYPAKLVLDGFVEDHAFQWTNAVCTNPYVRGILSLFAMTVRTIDPPALLPSRRWILLGMVDDPVCRRLIHAFQAAGMQG